VSRQIPADAALCLFRITQEALQNVVKHSGATAATVRLAQTGQHIRLHIADSGNGFDLASKVGAGLGLLSMRERVHFAGGRIGIRTVAGQGTRIVVTLPMPQAGESIACRSRAQAGVSPVSPLVGERSSPRSRWPAARRQQPA
jgi:signal transduction histidine kinase